MTKLFTIIILSLIAFTGCRREDIREFSIEMPSFTVNDKDKIIAELSKYAGVQKSSFQWDLEKKTLSMKYDSMQIARTNIRMAIEKVGVEVLYPTNTTGRAGY